MWTKSHRSRAWANHELAFGWDRITSRNHGRVPVGSRDKRKRACSIDMNRRVVKEVAQDHGRQKSPPHFVSMLTQNRVSSYVRRSTQARVDQMRVVRTFGSSRGRPFEAVVARRAGKRTNWARCGLCLSGSKLWVEGEDDSWSESREDNRRPALIRFQRGERRD